MPFPEGSSNDGRPRTEKVPRLRGQRTAQERYVAPRTQKMLYVIAFLLTVAGAGLFFLILAGVQQKADLATLDGPVNTWFVSQRSEATTVIMSILAIIFGPIAMPIIVSAVIVIWMVTARHVWRPLLLGGAMVTGVILAQIVSRLVGRPRPPLELMLLGGDSTYSFPSGHVLGASDFVLVGAFLVLSRSHRIGRVISGFCIAVAVIVTQAISRLYLGYHWLTDVLASISLSFIVLGAVIALDTWRTTRVSRAGRGRPALNA